MIKILREIFIYITNGSNRHSRNINDLLSEAIKRVALLTYGVQTRTEKKKKMVYMPIALTLSMVVCNI